MTTDPVSCVLPVSADRAWQLLEDPRSLKFLVVGAQAVRRFDPCWPDVGTAVHHSIGIPPLVIHDTTFVTVCEPGRRLVLKASVRPFGRFEVDFRLRGHEEGSELEVYERVLSGPLSIAPLAKATDALVKLRNNELCRRFRRLVERREQQYERLASSYARSGRSGSDA